MIWWYHDRTMVPWYQRSLGLVGTERNGPLGTVAFRCLGALTLMGGCVDDGGVLFIDISMVDGLIS